MNVFELIMLVCFGAAWPVSIYKSYKSQTNSGKSLLFLVIILLGYLSGSAYKMFFNRDGVLALYLLNTSLVFIDLLIFVRNSRLCKKKTMALCLENS